MFESCVINSILRPYWWSYDLTI